MFYKYINIGVAVFLIIIIIPILYFCLAQIVCCLQKPNL